MPSDATGPPTVLYIQHARSLGGSCASLRQMLDVFDRARYRPIVAVAQAGSEVERYHAEGGVETLAWPGIGTFEHTTGGWFSLHRPVSWPLVPAALAGWRKSERRTLELVAATRPDLVHLNSAVLLPSARALWRAGVPFVWHVRETPVRGIAGLRLGVQRRALTRWPDEVVFLSEGARQAWLAGVRGRVIPELVDPRRFDPGLDREAARRELGIAPTAPVVLYAGGPSAIKGMTALLDALGRVRARVPGVLALMPGAEVDVPPVARFATAILPFATLTGQVRRALSRGGLGESVRLLPFQADMPRLMAASDLVVFPSTTDHFARPIIEAWAMAKPVVASRLPMIEEQVEDGVNGLLVPPGDSEALAEAMIGLLAHPERARSLGEAGRRIALERFDARRNTQAMMALYDDVLAARRERRARPA